MSGDGLQRDRRILHRARKWSDLIETGGEGHQAKPRDPPVCRLQTDNATESGWLANRTAGIGTKADRSQIGRNRRRRPATAPSRNPFRMPRVADWLKGR